MQTSLSYREPKITAHVLSQKDDLKNQVSRLEKFVKERGHETIFFQSCELNPTEMTGVGEDIGIGKMINSNSILSIIPFQYHLLFDIPHLISIF